MARVRILIQPTGCINGVYWPAAGEEIDLHDAVAESMAEAGSVEIVKAVKVEKRPASTAKVEKRA